MYKLSVGCLFKNESHSLVEWLEHYIFHGVSHFYMIDDNSTDNSCDILEPYIKKGLVTLFKAKWDYYLGRQRAMYNEYILPRLDESRWLLMCDLDEYMWSPRNIDLNKILETCNSIGQIQVNHTLFGSSGFINQPKSIVSSFTKRAAKLQTEIPGNRKYFINCSYKFDSLNTHHATFINKDDELNKFLLLDETYFRLNHYCCQSIEFWDKVKCKRGDSDNYRIRTLEDFKEVDLNDIEDISLLEQNRNIVHSI